MVSWAQVRLGLIFGLISGFSALHKLGFRASGFGFRASGFGFRASGFGLGSSSCGLRSSNEAASG